MTSFNYMQKPKKNQSYKIGCNGLEIQKVFQNATTADRVSMKKQFEVHFDFFKEYGITNYQDFVTTLHDYKFRAGDILNLIKTFVEYKSYQNSANPIFLLKKRELKKANAGEKNVLLNRLAVEYSSEFLSFFQNYVHSYCFFSKKTKDQLIQRIRTKIERLVKEKVEKNDETIDTISDNSSEFPDLFPLSNETDADVGYDDLDMFSNDESADFNSLFTDYYNG